MAKSGVKKNYIYNLAYQILAMLAPLITTPYISRILGAKNIGIYSYTLSIVTYFTLFLVLGLHMYGQREIAYSQDDLHNQSVIFARVQLYKLITTFICLVLYIMYTILFSEHRLIMLAQGIAIFTAFFDISWYFIGCEQFSLMVMRNTIVKIVGIASVFVFVKSSDDLLLYVFIMALINLLGNLSLWGFLFGRLDRIALNEINIFKDNRTIIELFIPLIAVQVYNVLDKTMLGSSIGDLVECGYYEQTTKIINLCMTIITSFGTVLAPHMATEFVKGNKERLSEQINNAFIFIGAIMFPVFWGIVSIVDNMVPWFFGNGYDKVALLIKLYAVVLLIIPISNLASCAILTPSKQHNKSTIAVIIGALVNFLLNLIIIPHFMSVGAAVATIVAEIIVTVLHLYYVRDYLNFRVIFVNYAKYCLMALGMGVVSYVVGKMLKCTGINGILLTAVQIIAGVMVYGLLTVFVIKDNNVVAKINELRRKVR